MRQRGSSALPIVGAAALPRPLRLPLARTFWLYTIHSDQPFRYSRCNRLLAGFEFRILPLSVSYSIGPSTSVARLQSWASSVSGPPISKPEKVLPLPLHASIHSH